MADLRTDYKDDVLNTTSNTRRKYRMITNTDGTVSFTDVTTYTTEGDDFGAVDVNAITEAVNGLNQSLADTNAALNDALKWKHLGAAGNGTVSVPQGISNINELMFVYLFAGSQIFDVETIHAARFAVSSSLTCHDSVNNQSAIAYYTDDTTIRFTTTSENWITVVYYR